MKLSLAVVTKDSASYIERLLRAGRVFADEIVVAIDSSTTDRTEEICSRYANRLFRIEPTGPGGERALAWLNDQCSGDWILRLDDDELPSAGLVEALPRLLRDRLITHYWLPRRWVVGHEQARWLAGPPWWPDWQLRLFRNIPSIVRVPGRLHTSYVVQGEARHIYDGAIYHYDLVYHTLAERQHKVERYDELSPGNRDAFLYLVPDDLTPDDSTEPIAPIPGPDPPFEGAGESYRWVSDSPGQGRPVIPVPPEDVQLARLWRTEPEQFLDAPDIFRAGLVVTNCPVVMTAGEIYWVDVEVRNDTPVIWPSPGVGIPEVIVTYHWLQPSGERHHYLGLQSPVPHTLRPGKATMMAVLIQAPADPGDYLLQWDLLIEQVAWFTTQGWQGPVTAVRVIEDAASAMQRMARLLHPKLSAPNEPKAPPTDEAGRVKAT